jgi:hypothetical protein
MNNKLFKIIKGQGSFSDDPNELGKIVQSLNPNSSKSARLIPVQTGVPIDVVNDFKWTKTSRNSEGRKNTPTVELEEFEVVVPAFFSNLNIVQQVLTTTGEGIADSLAQISDLVGLPESVASVVSDGVGAVKENLNILAQGAFKAFGAENKGMPMPTYLKAYENLYGVKRTKFRYNLPYLENKYKSVENSWGGGEDSLSKMMGDTAAQFVTDSLFKKISPGVGIDYSKSFEYGATGPSHTISFYLDNTKDSEYTGEVVEGAGYRQAGKRRVVSNYETNFRFIYLLIYQNLPNRINRITYVPPVIYRAKLPGVFSYRWSYLNNITVDMIGVRRTKTIHDFENGKPVQAVIPEGYQVSLTIQSLVPETQNLYYDAVSNNVNVSVAP